MMTYHCDVGVLFKKFCDYRELVFEVIVPNVFDDGVLNRAIIIALRRCLEGHE